MRIEEFVGGIGFNEKDMETYVACREKVVNEIYPFVKKFADGLIEYGDAWDEAAKIDTKGLHRYTLALVFLVECSHYTYESKCTGNVTKELFLETMKDIKYKLDECIKSKKIFGIFVVGWFKKFFTFERVTLGRLQYDFNEYGDDPIEVKGFKLEKGDTVLNCHIPSSGPLKSELVVDSLKMAYEFFKDKLKNGVLPVVCNTWLFYPEYLDVFGKESNTGKFIRSFEIYSINKTEEFSDAWRVFNMDFDGDAEKLPSDTTMQKNFISYIRNGGAFGTARGILLFDGEKILTLR